MGKQLKKFGCYNNGFYDKYVDAETFEQALYRYMLWVISDSMQEGLPKLPKCFKNCRITIFEVGEDGLPLGTLPPHIQSFNVDTEYQSANQMTGIFLKFSLLDAMQQNGRDLPAVYCMQYFYNI